MAGLCGRGQVRICSGCRQDGAGRPHLNAPLIGNQLFDSSSHSQMSHSLNSSADSGNSADFPSCGSLFRNHVDLGLWILRLRTKLHFLPRSVLSYSGRMDCPSEDHESQTPPDDPAFHIGPTTPQPSSTIPCLQLFPFPIRLWETWNPFNTI